MNINKINDIWNKITNQSIDGTVSTPFDIAYSIIKECDIKNTDTVIDPCVGHGVFIFALLEYIKIKYNYSKTRFI